MHHRQPQGDCGDCGGLGSRRATMAAWAAAGRLWRLGRQGGGPRRRATPAAPCRRCISPYTLARFQAPELNRI